MRGRFEVEESGGLLQPFFIPSREAARNSPDAHANIRLEQYGLSPERRLRRPDPPFRSEKRRKRSRPFHASKTPPHG